MRFNRLNCIGNPVISSGGQGLIDRLTGDPEAGGGVGMGGDFGWQHGEYRAGLRRGPTLGNVISEQNQRVKRAAGCVTHGDMRPPKAGEQAARGGEGRAGGGVGVAAVRQVTITVREGDAGGIRLAQTP